MKYIVMILTVVILAYGGTSNTDGYRLETDPFRGIPLDSIASEVVYGSVLVANNSVGIVLVPSESLAAYRDLNAYVLSEEFAEKDSTHKVFQDEYIKECLSNLYTYFDWGSRSTYKLRKLARRIDLRRTPEYLDLENTLIEN